VLYQLSYTPIPSEQAVEIMPLQFETLERMILFDALCCRTTFDYRSIDYLRHTVADMPIELIDWRMMIISVTNGAVVQSRSLDAYLDMVFGRFVAYPGRPPTRDCGRRAVAGHWLAVRSKLRVIRELVLCRFVRKTLEEMVAPHRIDPRSEEGGQIARR
jgi:hypothetical protein